VRKAVSVNPGKYGPMGKISIPMISPRAYETPAHKGPYRIDVMATGRKPKESLKEVGIKIAKILVKRTSKVIINDITTNLVILECFLITFPPILQ
jgi:hypothetical protein